VERAEHSEGRPDYAAPTMAARRRLYAGALTIAALAIGPIETSTGDASGRTAPQPVDLTVMTFNIWYGATVTHGLDEVVRGIREAGADVVGLQEPYARIRRIAKELGYHASPRMHLLSRFPILEPAGSNGDWAYLLLAPGEVAAIANTHLTCCPYTPYRIVNRGFDRAEAVAQERRTRLDQIRDHLSALEPLLFAGVPTFFTGDFNAPSHRDWTPAAVRARGLPYTMRWPVSLAMEAAGFRDSYREVFPDPVADPGFTWTAGYPAPYVYPWEVFDRIDFVWAAGPVETTGSTIIGESRANADIAIRPYPSDHRAVASSFIITPALMPVSVVAEGESARLGLPLRARFHAEEPGDHVILTATGSTTPLADLPAGPGPDGTVAFDTTQLEQGAYDVVLLDATDSELSRDTVVLIADDQLPVLTVADPTLAGDQRLEVSWAFAPGNRFDWLAVFRAGVSAKEGPYKAWRYTEARIDGSSTIGPGARGPAPWPLPAGRYEVRFCLDDSYRCRGSAPFRVLG
jgi:endonuclease/exonuclease/phosphatase family metal-dependent hydrolase